MTNDRIGVTFIPTAQNQAQGPQQYATEGGIGGSNLDQAFKILSLHLPTVLGARAITPLSSTPTGAGGLHPQAAIFQALVHAMLGGSGPMSLDTGGTPASDGVSSAYRDFLASATANTLPTGGSSSAPPPGLPSPNPIPKITYDQPPRQPGPGADASQPTGGFGGTQATGLSDRGAGFDRTRY